VPPENVFSGISALADSLSFREDSGGGVIFTAFKTLAPAASGRFSGGRRMKQDSGHKREVFHLIS
jgi:hypothetical protein